MKKHNKYKVVNKQIHNKSQSKRNQLINSNPFSGNLVNGMNFGGKDHNLSGYVSRTIVIKDRQGNVKLAKEKQFFNSGKNPMNISVNSK